MVVVDQVTQEREKIIEQVRLWGGGSSDAVLDHHFQFFSTPTVEGLIGYRQEYDCAVVFGDPMCSKENQSSLVEAFHQFCQQKGWSVIYMLATEDFAHKIKQSTKGILIEYGEELFMNPHDDPRKKKGNNASLVRRKERHALHEGVVFKEYNEQNPSIEQAFERVAEEWLKGRKGPQVYISHVRLFEDRLGKRWFYAERNGKIVGVIVANQLQSMNGWLINKLMITPDAPHGTPELLLVQTLETLAQEGAEYVTFGNVPSLKLGRIEGLSTFFTNILRFSFKILIKFFHLEGRKKFWEKFDPQEQSSYIVFAGPDIGIKEIKGLLKALNISF